MIVLLGGSSLVVYKLQRALAAGWTREQPAAPPVLRNGPVPPGLVSEPPLQGTPSYQRFGPAEVLALRRDEERVLNSYGMTDREHGIVRIPIRQAMQLLVERGPNFQEKNR